MTSRLLFQKKNSYHKFFFKYERIKIEQSQNIVWYRMESIANLWKSENIHQLVVYVIIIFREYSILTIIPKADK